MYAFTPTYEEFQDYWFIQFDQEDEKQLNPLLIRTGHRIVAALQAGGQLDCGWPEWAHEYLKELNIIIAMIMFNANASRISSEQRELYQEYVTEQLSLLRTGDIVVCSGETAKTYPAWAEANYGLTARNTARIDVANPDNSSGEL